MSTILKALRRLEEEKSASEEARPLREQIASEPRIVTRRTRRSGWAAAAIALVLGVAAGGGVIWWLFGRTPEPAQIAAVPAPVPAPPPQAAPAPTVAAVDPGLPTQAFESDVEIVDRPDALPRIADGEPVTPSIPDPKPGSVRPVENSSAAGRARQAALAEYNAAERARRGLPPEPVPAAPPAPLEPVNMATADPAPVPDVAQAAPPAPAPVATPAPATSPVPMAAASPAPSPKPAPRKVEKPAPPRETAAQTPTPPSIAVSVERTQWHPLADRRIAWLNVAGGTEPKRVVEGDVIDGLLVSKIEPSGVVFERGGEKIRRGLGQH